MLRGLESTLPRISVNCLPQYEISLAENSIFHGNNLPCLYPLIFPMKTKNITGDYKNKMNKINKRKIKDPPIPLNERFFSTFL